MLFAMAAQFCGIALFATITGEVFQWRSEATVEKMVHDKQEEIKNMLFTLSRIFDQSG